MSQLEELIFKYFDDGFWYKEILEFLEFVHGYSLSLSSLKRILRRNNKKRRALRCSQQELSDAVERELGGSSNNAGYRRMHRILISKGIRCRREDVRKMVCDKDPEGVHLRKRRRLRRRKYLSPGPNFVWHIDGHNKLKPYGFSIHGGIDVHIISSSRYQGPRGRPDIMYFLPHLYNRQNLGTEVHNDEIDELYPSVTVELQDYSPEFGEFARTVLESAGYNSHVTDVGAALDLYVFLLMNK